VPAHHLGHVVLVERAPPHGVEAVEGLLVLPQQDGMRIGRRFGRAGQLLVQLRVVGQHLLAEVPHHLARAFLLGQLRELHLEQAEAQGLLDEVAV
jgi:hypothetical protein